MEETIHLVGLIGLAAFPFFACGLMVVYGACKIYDTYKAWEDV